jgi:hypothetical protein
MAEEAAEADSAAMVAGGPPAILQGPTSLTTAHTQAIRPVLAEVVKLHCGVFFSQTRSYGQIANQACVIDPHQSPDDE